MINKLKHIVFNECRKKENKLDESFFDMHVMVVVYYGERLGEYFNADQEIIKLSGYLHDISAIYDYNTIPQHNIISAKIARNILLENRYDVDRINKIEKCIISHKEPLQINNGTKEEICLSNADALSFIARPLYWLFFAFKILNLPFYESKKWVIAKNEDNWNKIIDPAKKMIEKNYIENKKIFNEY